MLAGATRGMDVPAVIPKGTQRASRKHPESIPSDAGTKGGPQAAVYGIACELPSDDAASL